ncbi:MULTISPECIES: M20 metallopeptidase family protein [Clostridium]|jgi:amidohydrolase|uniref:M20 family metallopeptidase n=1 Tax=Clostridium lapidicellarium TaxID=3240931 RepID=A0ABV4DWX7_9CLOT|nr:M20 family metallopeptidase [uncultured Clostridium sp.]NLU09175.1 amidohydrolase [Clostridiales bacterium]
MESDILGKATDIKDWLVNLRRDFHRHPEQSFKEYRTSKIIAQNLINMGIKVDHIGETGIVGILEGNSKGNVIALRADIDALSVTEKTGLPFSSENIGYMHACGHDFHTSMLLGAAKLLSERKNELKGTVKFLFQPAEELAEGAKQMVQGGALENPDVDYIFGMHVWSDIPVNKVSLQEGPIMASADTWKLKVLGKSCHGSSSWEGVDSLVCSSAIVQGIQTIISRINDVRSPVVINIGTIRGGERFNITPGTTEMEGMNRTFNVNIRNKIPKWMERIIKNTCSAYGCDYKFDYNFKCSVTDNEPKYTRSAIESIKKFMGEDGIINIDRIMGSEDFSEYLGKIPGSLMLLGGRNEEKGCNHSHHSNYFNVDEDALPIGTAAYTQVAIDFLS